MKKLIVILVVGLLVVAGLLWGVSAFSSTFKATLTVEFSSRSTGEVYDADMDLEVNDEFLERFFTLSLGSPFPDGDNRLEITIYEGTVNVMGDKELYSETWQIGNLYKDAGDMVEKVVDITIELPKDYADADKGAVYLWAVCKWEGRQVGQNVFTLNPETMNVT